MPKNLTTFSIALCALTLFVACGPGKSTKESKTPKEFEGIITYCEAIRNKDSTLNLDDTVRLYYSHGNYVGIHSEPSPKLHVVKDYYLKDKPLRLVLFNNSDTLHQLSLNFPGEKLDHFIVKKIYGQILSRTCEEIDVSTTYPENGLTTFSDFTFVFSRGYLNVNKEYFKNWHLGFFNKMIEESGALNLKWKAVHFDNTHKNMLSSKSYDVIFVEEQAIDPQIFEIDATKIKYTGI